MSDYKFVSHLDEVMKDMDAAIQRALNAMGVQLERNAKTEINKAVYDTPESPSYVRTGRLRASLTYATKTEHSDPEPEADPSDAKMLGQPKDDTVYVGTNVEYAPYVEFGTSRMHARPYLKPALENHMDEYKTIAATELNSMD